MLIGKAARSSLLCCAVCFHHSVVIVYGAPQGSLGGFSRCGANLGGVAPSEHSSEAWRRGCRAGDVAQECHQDLAPAQLLLMLGPKTWLCKVATHGAAGCC